MQNRSHILKIAIACMLLVISVCIAGCSDSHPGLSSMIEQRMAGADSLEKNRPKLQAMGEQLIDALINKDIDALKKIMSPAAVATEDFEKGFEYSYSFFGEEIVSIEMGGSHDGGVGTSTFGGTYFKLTTVNQNEIVVSFNCYFTDGRNPDNIGISDFAVTTPDSIKPNEHSDYIRTRFGIFNPEWNDVENE